MFEEWKFAHLIDGNDPLSWLYCVLGCINHNYIETAQRFLILMNIAPNYEWFNNCCATTHWVCNVCPEYHHSAGKCSVMKLGKHGKYQAGKMAQHFCSKYQSHVATMEKAMLTFRSVFMLYLCCIHVVFVLLLMNDK